MRWREQALCAQSSRKEAFFDDRRRDEAKAICSRCPVREACLDYSLKTEQPEGVWGGLSTPERRTAQSTIGGVPLDRITYTTRARSTGATCSAGRTETGWGAACTSHGTTATARSRTAAEYAVSRPQEWCPACAAIAQGDAPKL